MDKKKYWAFGIVGLVFVILFSYLVHLSILWWINEPQIPIYMYHAISENPRKGNKEMYVTPKDFEAHLIHLKEEGYDAVFADEIKDITGYDRKVIITFDDGYTDNYTVAYPILKKYNMKATIFVIADRIGTDGYMTEKQLKELADSGIISIQSHSDTHINLIDLPENSLIKELKRSKEKISEITGKEVNVISYPGGRYNEYVIKNTKKYYDYGYAVHCMDDGDRFYEIERCGVYRSEEDWGIEGSIVEESQTRLQKLKDDKNSGKKIGVFKSIILWLYYEYC